MQPRQKNMCHPERRIPQTERYVSEYGILSLSAVDPFYFIRLLSVGISEDEQGFHFHSGSAAPPALDQRQIRRKLRPVAHEPQAFRLKAVAAHAAEDFRQPLRFVYQSKAPAGAAEKSGGCTDILQRAAQLPPCGGPTPVR